VALGERMKAFWGPRVPRREREGSRKSASQRRGSKSSKKQFRHVSIIGGDKLVSGLRPALGGRVALRRPPRSSSCTRAAAAREMQ